MARRKTEMNEPDINFRAAFALSGWRPIHPLEKAAEYFEFDFEFGDEPEDSGLKANAKVLSLMFTNLNSIKKFTGRLTVRRI